MSKTAPKFAGLKDRKSAPTPSAKIAPPSNDAGKKPASRADKKALTGYFHPQTVKTLKMICVMQDITQEQAMSEALDDYFRKHGQSPVGG